MELDDFKLQWQIHDRSLETLLRLRQQPVQNTLNRAYRKMRRSSRWAILWAIVDLMIGLALLAFLGNFIADHITQLHLAVPAIVLHLLVIASMVIVGRQLYWIHAIDYQRPILEIQQRLESLRIERLRGLLLILLLAPLLWILMLLVGLKAFLGMDLFEAPWLRANILFGLVWIPVAWWGSRLLARWRKASPLVQRVARGIAGSDLAAAREFLQELERYEESEAV